MLYPFVLGFRFKDYRGGDNPILVYIFIACVILGLGATFWVYYKRWSLRKAFYALCQEKQLSESQIGFFVHFMNVQKIPLSPLILTNRVTFDKFLNRVGYHFVTLHGPHYQADEELVTLIQMRRTLFPSSTNESLSTSRALPKKLPIKISFFDEKKSRYSTFESSIHSNVHCGIWLEVGDVPGVGEVKENSPLRIKFRDPSGKMVKAFESFLMRVMYENDQPYWLVQHSYFIQKEEVKKLSLQGKLYLKQGADLIETPVSIIALSASSCTISQGGFQEKNGLLQVVLLDKECNFNVQVEGQDGEHTVLVFKSLDDDLRSQIRKAMR